MGQGDTATAASGQLEFFRLLPLRAIAALLIVLGHSAMAYLDLPFWFVPDSARATLLWPAMVMLWAPAIGIFFFIAGYSLPLGDQDGVGWQILRARVKKFLPAILFMLILVMPAVMYGYFLTARDLPDPGFLDYVFGYFWGMRGSSPEGWSGHWPDHNYGHLWFIAQLVLFLAVYGLARKLGALGLFERWRLQLWQIPAIMLLLSLVTWAVRLDFPLFYWRGFLGFFMVQPAQFSGEVACFVLGIAARRGQWSGAIAPVWSLRLPLLGLGGVAIYWIAELSGAGILNRGGPTFGAFAFTLWQTAVQLSLILGVVLVLLHRPLPLSGPFWYLASHSYALYLVHFPIVIALQHALRPVDLPGLVKALLVFAAALPLALALVALLRRSRALRAYL